MGFLSSDVSSLLLQVGDTERSDQIQQQLDRIVTRSRDPWPSAVDALVSLLKQFHLIYALPSVQLLPHLLHRINMEGILAILIAMNRPRSMQYSNILRLFVDFE